MTKGAHINYWIKTAEDDLEFAFETLSSKRYVWSLFLGHLALEKMLKAYFVKKFNNRTPPKLHNLNKLAHINGIKLSEEQMEFYAEVNRFQIEGRYPKMKDGLNRITTQEFTTEFLTKIKENFQWLKSLI